MFPQFSTMAFCVSTIFQLLDQWFFVETQFGTMEFCVSTIFHYGILCFHKVPPILMNQSMINEGGTLANFFSEPFQFPSSKIDQTWISMIGPPGKPSNSPHFSTRLIIILGYPFRNETGFFVLKSIPNMLKPL